MDKNKLTQSPYPDKPTGNSSPLSPAEIIRQQDALTETICKVRALRDDFLRQDAHSHAGLVLGQISLVLERLRHGIPSGGETFVGLLRAGNRIDEKPAEKDYEKRKAVEVE